MRERIYNEKLHATGHDTEIVHVPWRSRNTESSITGRLARTTSIEVCHRGDDERIMKGTKVFLSDPVRAKFVLLCTTPIKKISSISLHLKSYPKTDNQKSCSQFQHFLCGGCEARRFKITSPYESRSAGRLLPSEIRNGLRVPCKRDRGFGRGCVVPGACEAS